AGRRAGGDVLAGDAAGDGVHLDARHPLRVAHGARDRAARLVDVPHHPAPHARVLRQPDAQRLGQRHPEQVADDFRDHGARLGAAEIEPGHELAVPAHAPPSPPLLAVGFRRTTTWPAKRASSSAYDCPFAARSCATNTTARITSAPASRPTTTRPRDPRGPGASGAGSTSRTSTVNMAGKRRITRASATPARPRTRSAKSRVSLNTLARGPSRSAAITASGVRLRTPTSSTWR